MFSLLSLPPPVVVVRSLINPNPGCRAAVIACLVASYIQMPPSPGSVAGPPTPAVSGPLHKISCLAQASERQSFPTMIQMNCDKDLMHRWETRLCFCGVAPSLLYFVFVFCSLFISLVSHRFIVFHTQIVRQCVQSQCNVEEATENHLENSWNIDFIYYTVCIIFILVIWTVLFLKLHHRPSGAPEKSNSICVQWISAIVTHMQTQLCLVHTNVKEQPISFHLSKHMFWVLSFDLSIREFCCHIITT